MAVRTRNRATTEEVPDLADPDAEIDNPSDGDLDDLMNEDDIDPDAVDLYQAVDFEADIDQDHCDESADADCDPRLRADVPANTRSAPFAHLPMQVTISGIITDEKTDDLCQTDFATMAQAK